MSIFNLILIILINNLITNFGINIIIKYFKHPSDNRSLYYMKYLRLINFLGIFSFLFRKKILKENTISYYEYLINSYETYGANTKFIKDIELSENDYINLKRRLKLIKLNKI